MPNPKQYFWGLSHCTRTHLILVWVLGLLSAFIYWQIQQHSLLCTQWSPQKSRPILSVLYLFTISGVLYLLACWRLIWKKRQPFQGRFNPIGISVIGFAILFRGILLFSTPIQEVDLYRYIWDGVVTSQGISPYKYSPEEIADVGAPESLNEMQPLSRYRRPPSEQQTLSQLSQTITEDNLQDVFDLVHFKQYTTPYPPTNQPIFAMAATSGKFLGSFTDSFHGYLHSMKGTLILFDLATAAVLFLLLRHLRLPEEWTVAYLWCPLLLKEIANSGHLDSIAVFFTTAAIALLTNALWKRDEHGSIVARLPSNRQAFKAASAMILLALGVAAKIYPLILLPVFATLLVKRLRGVGAGIVLACPVLLLLMMLPMLQHTSLLRSTPSSVSNNASYPPPGIEAFAKFWEMNDFLFMVMVENLKPTWYQPTQGQSTQGQSLTAAEQSPVWFAVTSNSFRKAISKRVASVTGVPKTEVAFWLTRRVTLAAFALIVLWSCYRVYRNDNALLFLEMTFLTIAWFWLLAPTQNPWYWTWALPTLCFCRNRLWYALALIAMAYYLRFYCEYHLAAPDGIWGTPYSGTALFDFIVPVLEFGPFLALLFISWAIGKTRTPTALE